MRILCNTRFKALGFEGVSGFQGQESCGLEFRASGLAVRFGTFGLGAEYRIAFLGSISWCRVSCLRFTIQAC